jgi:hypothetical protein
VEGRIVAVPEVRVVHVVQDAVVGIGWHNALVVGRGDVVELEAGMQDAGMAKC